MTLKKIGRYEIKSELGRGGMATVYRAEDPHFGREVAIKVLPREFLHDITFRERFEREARTIATLEHSSIVPVYDYGQDEDLLYLVMRLMPGGSLSRRIDEGPLSPDQAAKVLQRVGAALDEAHKKNVIHRDLKPGNILFDQYGDAYLSDFGIVKLMEAGASLTGTGIVGTPSYMSPEQARGEKDIDGRTDVYSLGVILFEMLTGQAPYDADTPMGIAIKHILDPVPEILAVNPDLPADVEQIILCAMAKEPDDRFETATELAEAVTVVAQGEALPESVTSKAATSLGKPRAASPPAPKTEPAQPTIPLPAEPLAPQPEAAQITAPQAVPLTLNLDELKPLRMLGVVFGLIVLAHAVARLGHIFPVQPMAFCWPFFIIGPGLLFFAGIRASRGRASELAIPGSIIAGVGALLLYQSIFKHWESWAYAWTLIPVCVGIGLMIHGAWGGKARATRTGKGLVFWGTVAFLFMGALFETLINVSQSGLLRLIWPLALIGAGIYWWRSMPEPSPEQHG